MGAFEKHEATFHPGDGPTPRTAADVLREHEPVCICSPTDGDYGHPNCPYPHFGPRPARTRSSQGAVERAARIINAEVNYRAFITYDEAEDIARLLAAAGLLATAEHDAQVLRDAVDAWEDGPTRLAPIPKWVLRDRADRITAGETP
jgi:hypothetical protein